MELGQTPAEFVLYGGTALALRLGHRRSDDFDFFSTATFDPAQLRARVPYLRGAEVLRQEPNTLTCTVDLDAAIATGGIALDDALAAAGALHGSGFNPLPTLKALVYFDDGDLAAVPESVRRRLAEAVRAVDANRIPTVPSRPGILSEASGE